MTLDAAASARLPPRERAALVRALLELGQEEDAARVPADMADGVSLLDLRAESLLAIGRAEEALALILARESNRTSSISLGLRTRALARLGRVDDALAAVAKQGEEGSYLARTIRGEALLEANFADDARRELEAAVALEPARRRGLLALVRACDAQRDDVSGSAYAGRLLDTQDDETGALSARYLRPLRAFFARSGETNRLPDLDARIDARMAEAQARIETLLGRATAPAPPPTPRKSAPQAVAPSAMPDLPEGPPVTAEEHQRVLDLVKRYVGFSSLRAGQGETIARVMRGEDVLAILPTGAGKSICYQLPGVLTPGVTLIVSPLIALMKDQLDSLPPAMRAAAVSITSELTPDEIRGAIADIAEGRYRLVYVAPERLRTEALLHALRKAGVSRLVVDEAHCVSMWGHDFRPDYLGIADARRNLGDPPILAVTATAPPRVARDILQRLGRLNVVRTTVDRPNLRFEAILARDADDKLAHLFTLCQETPGPGIVYASSRAKCEQLATALHTAGLRADSYHAGLPDRARRQEAFMNGETDILVATVAFGMGVDKGDIRYVFHHDPSSSVENYYQESGRAGRDGAPARCVVLATGQDGGTLKQRAKGDLPSRDLISHVWASVLARATEGSDIALVPFEDLQDLGEQGDDVKPRVALSILAEAGAVTRIADVPLRFRVRGRGPLAKIPQDTLSVLDLAPLLDVAPEAVEARLLQALDEGHANTRSTGRAYLLRVHGDTSRIESVLERYAALAEHRGREIMDYVKSPRCRRAYLRAYFGEDAPATCDACDVCLGLAHEAGDIPGSDDETAARAVLEALGGIRGIGQLNLVWMLRGDARAPEWVVGKPGYGALSFRSESRIKALVESVVARGFAAKQELAHGGTTLQLTQEGAHALHGEGAILPEAPKRAPASSGASKARAPDDDEAPLDAEGAKRFDALRVWRREEADTQGVPPYVVAHDKTLRAIAAACPKDEAALLGVKGMGPKRVERYGKAILELMGA